MTFHKPIGLNTVRANHVINLLVIVVWLNKAYNILKSIWPVYNFYIFSILLQICVYKLKVCYADMLVVEGCDLKHVKNVNMHGWAVLITSPP